MKSQRYLLFVMISLLIPACIPQTRTALNRDLIRKARIQDLHSRLELKVDAGTYRQGKIIGNGAGQELSLGQPIKSIIESNIKEAWSLGHKNTASYTVHVKLDNLSVSWPKGTVFIHPRVTAKAVVKLTVNVTTSQYPGKSLYKRHYVGLASDTFMDYRPELVGDDWQQLLNKAYQRCINELLEDTNLIVLLKTDPDNATPRDQTKPIIAVFDIRDTTNTLKDKLSLSKYLMGLIPSKLGYHVIPRDQIRKRILAQKRESYRHCYNQSCQIELGKALAAQQILAVEYLKVGHNCMFTATLYDLKTETTVKSATSKTTCSQTDQITAIDALITQLSR